MRFLRFLLIMFSAAACSGRNEVIRILDDAESAVQYRPAEALVMLHGISSPERLPESIRARHALLMSVALHKNNVDLASDSIIAPAVSYYGRHGTPEQKLQSYYYQGLAYYYASDYERAMECFAKAGLNLKVCRDHAASARLHMALKQMYVRRYDFGEAAESAGKAADAFMMCGDTVSGIAAMLSEANSFSMGGYADRADSVLKEMEPYLTRMDMRQLSVYHSRRLGVIKRIDASLLGPAISDMLASVDEEYLDHASLASAYCVQGDYDAAYDVLVKPFAEAGLYEEIGLTGLRAEVFHAKGMYEEASSLYAIYSERLDSLNMSLIRSKVPYVHERLASEIQELRRKNQVAALLFMILLLSASVIAASHVVRIYSDRRRREQAELEERLREAEKEITRLKRLRDAGRLDPVLKDIVDERLRILNGYVGREISSNAFARGGDDELRLLMSDRERFLESTWRTFMVAHPGFIRFLQDHGLKSREIGCCCLLCIGLRGNEIASYMNLTEKTYYNFSASVRKKLGLGRNDTNLGVFLCRKMSEEM